MTGLWAFFPVLLVDVFTQLGEDVLWVNSSYKKSPGSKCLLILLIFQNKFLDYEKRKVRINSCNCFVCTMGLLLVFVFHLFILFLIPLTWLHF